MSDWIIELLLLILIQFRKTETLQHLIDTGLLITGEGGLTSHANLYPMFNELHFLFKYNLRSQ